MGYRGDVYERYYMQAFIDTDCQAIYLGSTRREDLIRAFHKTVHTIEVDRQLQGILPADILTPSTIEYELKEQATIARLLFEPHTGLTEDQIIQKRIELVQNLIQLCKRQESPRQYRASKSKGRPRKHINSQTLSEDADSTSLIADITTRSHKLSKVSTLFCAFCKWNDNEAGPENESTNTFVLIVLIDISKLSTFNLIPLMRDFTILIKDVQHF
ncbi:predicted protein [Sclerotinia sclerotiorum 1980 UF-70]|uniref:Uncharacterized protein n=2 Tax=Sclerotinia sclerotiorum (strain ATCC 18683 / 1980 / Ss-1) TaxID=665079 RepID=A7EPA2_SCLS1|nr:predicted protein [Sclerotinia sclerotiorum 1980 UF-70]APA10374.1 hypothetical protein sscle_06g051440 [Sclerotinia sclerotiorum 1980 UF-70]EDO04668.1 predicted protein [Sclerotinia sclerotiorum 1980 UF-70]